MTACGPCRCDGTAERYSIAHVTNRQRAAQDQRDAAAEDERREWYAERPFLTDPREALRRAGEPSP